VSLFQRGSAQSLLMELSNAVRLSPACFDRGADACVGEVRCEVFGPLLPPLPSTSNRICSSVRNVSAATRREIRVGSEGTSRPLRLKKKVTGLGFRV
jgi:hypothetical protein